MRIILFLLPEAEAEGNINNITQAYAMYIKKTNKIKYMKYYVFCFVHKLTTAWCIKKY